MIKDNFALVSVTCPEEKRRDVSTQVIIFQYLLKCFPNQVPTLWQILAWELLLLSRFSCVRLCATP